MPTWVKVVISSILIAFMIALSASIEAEAASSGEPPLLIESGQYQQLTIRNEQAGTGLGVAISGGDGYIFSVSGRFWYICTAGLGVSYQMGTYAPPTSNTYYHIDTLDEDTLLHYSLMTSFSTVLAGGTRYQSIGDYDTLREGLDAVSALLDPVDPASPFAYDLPPGYALYLDVSGLDSVSVSSIITANSGVWRSPYRANQYIRFADDLPAQGAILQPSGEQIVYAGLGNSNLIGLYARAGYGQTFAPTRQYLVIYNPLGDVGYGGESGNSGTAVNPTMHINVSLVHLPTSHLYSLSTNIMSDGLISDVSGDYDLVDTDGTITAVDGNGDTYTPVVGGATLVDAPRDINDFLQSIANDVSGFFNGAISAVTTLVNTGSAFIGLLGQLYTWLPSEVFATLKAALILVITIGVIKVFV